MYGERRGLCRLLVGNLRERDYLEDPDVDGTLILRWIFLKFGVVAWTISSWFMIGTGGGHL